MGSADLLQLSEELFGVSAELSAETVCPAEQPLQLVNPDWLKPQPLESTGGSMQPQQLEETTKVLAQFQ